MHVPRPAPGQYEKQYTHVGCICITWLLAAQLPAHPTGWLCCPHTRMHCHEPHALCPAVPLQPAFSAADLPLASHPAGGEAAGPSAAGNSSSSSTPALLHVAADNSALPSSQQPSSCSHALPEELLRLADAQAPVALPPPHTVPAGSLDNRELDKLVGTLGRNKATWRRALVLSQWLQETGHVLDDRLCTTVSGSPPASSCSPSRTATTTAATAIGVVEVTLGPLIDKPLGVCSSCAAPRPKCGVGVVARATQQI